MQRAKLCCVLIYSAQVRLILPLAILFFLSSYPDANNPRIKRSTIISGSTLAIVEKTTFQLNFARFRQTKIAETK